MEQDGDVFLASPKAAAAFSSKISSTTPISTK
jgi:hypothetical protein